GLQGVHKARTFAVRPQASTAALTGHNPLEFADIYGASGLDSASGVDVAVWGWGSMAETLGDLAQFESDNSLTPTSTNVVCTDYDGYGSGTISTTDPTCQNFDQGSIEWDLDSQDIVAMTGGVKSLTFYAAYGGYNGSVTTSLNSIVDPPSGIPLASVINASFGECERFQDSGQGGDGSAQADDALFQIGQAQGQTWSVSTGDHGADECGDGGKNSASYPASSPYVIAVSGTTLNATPSSYVRETVWISSGGSPSSFEDAPSWQAGLTYGTFKGSRGPDVAFDGNPNTGAIIYVSAFGGYVQVGGTSLSAPIFAGAWARLIGNGAVDPMTPAGQQLYSFPASYFHDVRSGNNRGYIAKRGWDWATGRGSLDLSHFSGN
ncbi:MAG TPA: S53 family peptidase, partial [Rhodanobacteraceae bacterium]|nr:S53 family peptidase [Rhodanobacteraceae bacterium]